MSGVYNKNGKETTSYRFNEQCYLMQNLEDLASFNQSIDNKYRNLISIDNGNHLLMNKVYGTGFGSLFDISTPQIGLLVPTIRLFKIYPNGNEIEIKFQDHIDPLDLDNILLRNQRRPSAVGLKKLSWEDLGKQPALTGLSFRAALELELSDLSDLFKEIQGEGETSYKIADLVSFAPTLKLNEGEAEEEVNPDFFRVKMIVGWAEPPANELFNKSLRDAIRNNQLHLFLNLTNFTIDYKETGQIGLSIDYVGYIEGVLYDPRTDILGYNQKDFESLEERLKKAENDREELEKFEKNSIDKAHEKFLDVNVQKGIIKEEIENIHKEKREKIRIERSQLYEKFVNDLYDRRKIYHLDIPWEEIKTFVEDAEVKKGSPKPKKQSDAEIQEAKQKVSRLLAEGGNSDNLVQYVAVNDVKNPKSPNETRVNFVFLGDILDVALEAFYRQDTTVVAEIQQQLKREDYKFLFGSFNFENPNIPDQVINIPMVDIPISLNVFIAWWLRNVIDLQRTRLSIKDFFREFLTSVVINTLTLECFGEDYRPGMYEFYFNILSFPKMDDSLISGKRIKLEDIDFTKLRKGGHKGADEYNHFLLCGILGTKVKYDEFPSKAKDHSNGIYWMRVGMDSGLVKKITFAKTQMKYFKEAAIAGSFAENKGDILRSEPYNAEITLVGNNIFKPGMTIYIDPYSLGFRGSVPRNALRIGGYYKVIKVSNSIGMANFETKLNAVAELNMPNLKNKGEKPSPPTSPPIDEVK